jgi:nucleoside-diphosphate-sugar epimerase
MKVLFIGGTGCISAACVDRAIQKGMEVFLLNRGESKKNNPKEVTHIQCDMNDRKKMAELLKGHHFDTVVNWIAFTPDTIQQDIELFAGNTNQYIFISSASVYQKPPTHYLVTESTPAHNPYWEYSQNKIACEELLFKAYKEEDFPMTIVRPSHTYDETRIPSTFSGYTLVDRILNDKKVIVHDRGESLWTLTHNSDFAKGFAGLMGNIQTLGHAFHITSDEVMTWNQIIKTIAQQLGKEPQIIYIPSDFIASISAKVGAGLLGDKSFSMVFDNSKIKRFVPEFKATVSFSEGIRKTLKWYDEHPEEKKVDPEQDQLIEEIISAWENKFK